MHDTRSWAQSLPFFYGWVIIAIAFVTMGISVTARTAFSLLLPPLIDEFGWDRGLSAGAFSFGFLVSAFASPFVGKIIDKWGPRPVIEMGVLLLTAGLLSAPYLSEPWQLYATLGFLVGGGANLMAFTTHSQFLPNWFARKRALAISLAFSGVGAGALLLLPWLQSIIVRDGWRASCVTLAIIVACVLAPLNLFVRTRPQDLKLLADGDTAAGTSGVQRRQMQIVNATWAATDWTLGRAMRTARFWWIALGYFAALNAWYAVQVHQTKYLIDTGFDKATAAWALGFVSFIGIPGQIFFGWLSDRIGREWGWTIGCIGFVITCAALIALEDSGASMPLLYVLVLAQGTLGYALTPVIGPIVAEIFEGKHFGTIFGVISVAVMFGSATGPWMAGRVYDLTGSYRYAWTALLIGCLISIAAIWLASPRRIRRVGV